MVEGQWPIVGSVPPFLTQFIQQILRDSLCPVPGTVAGGGFTHMKEQVQPRASWRCSSSQENTISLSLPSGTDADTRDGPAVSADTIQPRFVRLGLESAVLLRVASRKCTQGPPGNSADMQILKPHPDLLNPDLLFHRLPGESEAHEGLRCTGLKRSENQPKGGGGGRRPVRL